MGDRVEAITASLAAPSTGATVAAVDAAATRLATGGSAGIAVYDAPPGGAGAGEWGLGAAWQLADGAVPKELAWGHPSHGSVLAAAASDGAVTLWHEACGPAPRAWRAAVRVVGRAAPTALAFAPEAGGPRLAVASADGNVRVYVGTRLLAGARAGGDDDDDTWELESSIDPPPPPSPASPPTPATCIAWRPHDAGDAGGDGLPALLAVGGGGGVIIHCYRSAAAAWAPAARLPTDDGAPASAVAWAASPGGGAADRVAVAVGARVEVWRLTGAADALQAARAASLPHASPVWRLEWQPLGGGLLACTEAGRAALWRETLAGEWAAVGALAPDGAAEAGATEVDV